MILEDKKDGIICMRNVHTGTVREMVMIFKGMDLTGIVSLKPVSKLKYDNYKYISEFSEGLLDPKVAYVVELGYNEIIFVKDKETAVTLFTQIHDILTK